MEIGSLHSAAMRSQMASPAVETGEEESATVQSSGHSIGPATQVTLSEAAKELLGEGNSESDGDSPDNTVSKDPADANELSDSEKQKVTELKARDAEVRAHEQAHVAAGGGHTGSIQYEFERGPDNRQYAVGGHVSIDTAPVAGNPTQTIQKAQTVRRAALAPNSPSGADRQVAAKAQRILSEARGELAAEKRDEDGSRDDALRAAGGANAEDEQHDNGPVVQDSVTEPVLQAGASKRYALQRYRNAA